MAAKGKDYKPEFTYEKLGEILKDSTQKAKTRKLDLEGKLYGICISFFRPMCWHISAVPLISRRRTGDLS